MISRVNIVYLLLVISPVFTSNYNNIEFIKNSVNDELPQHHNRSKRQSLCGSNQWRCQDGSCIQSTEKCDGVLDCPDGSDEIHALCKTTISTNLCVLPNYPIHGSYSMRGYPYSTPGDAYDSVELNVVCDQGYSFIGEGNLSCSEGKWKGKMPECIRFCKVIPDVSVIYNCLMTNDSAITRKCKTYEPSGTKIRPECKIPFNTTSPIKLMECLDGKWSSFPVCSSGIAECGIISEKNAQRLKRQTQPLKALPWHTGIYKKPLQKYLLYCGGTLLTDTVVISVAHCFWAHREKKVSPATEFAVTVGKVYREWDDERDFATAQKSAVKEIKVPTFFRAAETNYYNDLALVTVSEAFLFNDHVRPICLDFDEAFESSQLTSGVIGTIGGWGIDSVSGSFGEKLKILVMPYVSIQECILNSPPEFRPLLTSDKMCAGWRNGTALCNGDSGGGLVFTNFERGKLKHYLRGLASVGPSTDKLCNNQALTAYTKVSAVKDFIINNCPECLMGRQRDGQESLSDKPPTVTCVLPNYPQFGGYTVFDKPNVRTGSLLDKDKLNLVFACFPGYSVKGNKILTCTNGIWSAEVPECIPACVVTSHHSVTYQCLDDYGSPRLCQNYEPSGVSIKPVCKTGYYAPGDQPLMRCVNGTWDHIAICSPAFCRLNRLPGVDYHCQLSGDDIVDGYRKCKDVEPPGTAVRPVCQTPNYYAVTPFKIMNCYNGQWDFEPTCVAECGTLIPNGSKLLSGGQDAEAGEVPWHVGIYDKLNNYKHKCGGSLVSTATVITAAHCFWSDTRNIKPASEFAVAVGKLYKGWNSSKDPEVQKSDIREIRVPQEFRGAKSNFQGDIAVVIVTSPFFYSVYVRPLCVSFEKNFDRRQLTDDNMGKVAGWGLITENGTETRTLQVTQLPYVNLNKCTAMVPPGYAGYLTIDKFCAGYDNGTALCHGDSGGGLAFLDTQLGTNRYYLRGLVSTAPVGDNSCNIHTITSFTHLRHHKDFIEENWQL